MRKRAETWDGYAPATKQHASPGEGWLCNCERCAFARDVLTLLAEIERKDKALRALLDYLEMNQIYISQGLCAAAVDALAPLPEKDGAP